MELDRVFDPAEFEQGAQTTNNDRLHCYMLKSWRAATIFFMRLFL
jgi:hypothetical protein